MDTVSKKSQADWQTLLMQQSFSWSSFKFVLNACEDARLPDYKGSTLRGAFGAAFRKICCSELKQKCRHCLLNQSCPYGYVFETPNPQSGAIGHQSQHLPHPFVIVPPLSGQNYFITGDELIFHLHLFGNAISLLPYFVFAFKTMAEKGLGIQRAKFRLDSCYVYNNVESSDNKKIYDAQSQTLDSNYHIQKFPDVVPFDSDKISSGLEIDFITPARVIQRGKLIQKISFELLIRNLLRRISLISLLHCNFQWQLPFNDIIAQARDTVRTVEDNTRWYDWTRYSSRQQRRMKMGGLVGKMMFQGDFQPFLPLLYLGQFTHFGKNATFGLGKFKIKSEDN